MTTQTRARELVEGLRMKARQVSDAHKMLSDAKTRRQTDGGHYEGVEPEQTLEWKAADFIETALRSERDEVEGELRIALWNALHGEHIRSDQAYRIINSTIKGLSPEGLVGEG